jgi:site-specific recombinase XerD
MKRSIHDVANEVTAILQKEGLETYDQTKNLFREVRKMMQVTPPKKRQKRKSAKTITKEEMKHFLKTAARDSQTVGLIMETLYRTAVRSKELIDIQALDLQPSQHNLLITTHDNSSREVTITSMLASQLADHLDGRNQGPLFISNRGKAFSVRRIEQLVSDVADRAGLEQKVTPGTLRNSRIKHLRDAGMTEDDLADFV